MKNSLKRLDALGVPIGSIIDVGVNHSTPQLILAFRKHKHILVEPISDYFDDIHKNYAGMDYQLLEVAAGDVDSVVHIESFRKFGDGKVSHSEIVSAPGPNTREVPCVRLDTIIPSLSAEGPFLLKIDVEGDEAPAAILRGATKVLQQTSVVVIELIAPKFMELASMVSDAGFQVFDILDACYYRGTLWQVDVVFVRNDIIAANPALRPMTVGKFDLKDWRAPPRSIWERAMDKLRLKIRA